MSKRANFWAGITAATMALSAPPAIAQARAQAAPVIHDGTHDFDFNIGTWKTHLIRLRHPLSGSTETIAFDGTVSVHPIWGGAGMYEEIEADGPNGHWEGLTFFLYDPKSGQWRQRFVGSSSGQFQLPTIGEFKDGRGELYAQDSANGRSILVRGVWSNIHPDSHSYEESFSADGGKSWEVEIAANLTRIAPVAPPAFPASADGAHDFDFDMGLWHTRTERLVNPLTGSTQWIKMEGTTRVTPIWGGRANVAEFAADGPTGHLELISLRVFDPAAKQWSLHFATRTVGTWSVPMTGEFRGDRGAFYDQEDYNGRMILVRFTFLRISPTEARSEQAFSADGGKSWETNWVNHYTR